MTFENSELDDWIGRIEWPMQHGVGRNGVIFTPKSYT